MLAKIIATVLTLAAISLYGLLLHLSTGMDQYQRGQEQARIETLSNVNQMLKEEGWKIYFEHRDGLYRMVYPR